MNTIQQFKAARRVSVPLIIWKTPDAAATIDQVRKAMNGNTPVAQWDIVRGLMPANEQAAKLFSGKYAEAGVGEGNPPDMLKAILQLPKDVIVFMHNAHLFTDNSAVIQGIWNLRDANKSEHRTLVMLASHMRTPTELVNDVLVIDEALPTDEELQKIVTEQAGHAATGAKESAKKFKEIDKAIMTKATDALSGLSAFAAEQVTAVSFEEQEKVITLNLDTLWDRKRQAIEETRGLRVWKGGETLEDVKGCYNVKAFMDKIIKGKRPPRAIVFIDEIEKALGGIAGDTSGTSQDQLAVLLTEMQDKQAQGLLFVGHPGSAKSMVAKATGATAGAVTIQLDLGAMKGSLVGESEQNIRAAVKVIESVSQGKALYIATCNKIGVIPPELQRRFTLGTFFFDLPSEEERAEIWKAYMKKFEMPGASLTGVEEEGWTGADIFNCCNRAWMFSCSLKEAAAYATPICKTRPKEIDNLRNLAENAFISASYAGLYRKPVGGKGVHPTAGQTPGSRKISFKD